MNDIMHMTAACLDYIKNKKPSNITEVYGSALACGSLWVGSTRAINSHNLNPDLSVRHLRFGDKVTCPKCIEVLKKNNL